MKDVGVPVLKGSGEAVAKKRKLSEADSLELPQKARYGEAEEERRGKEKGRLAKQEGEEEEQEEVECISPVKQWRKLSTEQTHLISACFASEISQRHFPSTRECQDFLCLHAGHFPGCTPKDVYDKCRNIAKRS